MNFLKTNKKFAFDIVIPTFRRKDKLIRCLNSIPNQDNIKVWICFDNNDFETYTYFVENYPNLNWNIMYEQYRAFGIWNYHLQYRFRGDIMCFLCDDTSLYPDTLKNVEKHFKEKFPDTDGVVTFNQCNIKGSDSAMGCVGRKFAERYHNRQVFCINYKTFYADSELGDYAKKLGKFHYGEDCKINHYHPAFFKNEIDQTHNIIRDKEKDIDVIVNKKRKEQGLLWGESFKLIDRDIK